MQQLISVSLVGDNLEIRFKDYWYQEDIEQLYQLLFEQLTDFSLVESLLGADRQTYRLTCDNQYVLLHFDYYSQSCWFNVETANDQPLLSKLIAIFQPH